MPKLALVSGSFQPRLCGVAHYTAQLTRELNARGVDALILTKRVGEPDPGNSFGVLEVADEWSWAGLLRLARSISRLRPDIVHVQHTPPSFGYRRTPLVLPPLLRLAGWRGPVIVTAHEYGSWDMKFKYIPEALVTSVGHLGERHGWLDRESLFLLTLSRAIVVTNDLHYESIKRKLPGLSSRLIKVPIGPNIPFAQGDRSEFRMRTQSRFALSSDDRVIVYFGFLHPVKGLEALLAAVKHLTTRGMPIKLVIVGGQESLALQGEEARDYRQRLISQSTELEIADRVIFTGYLPEQDVSEILQAADACVLPFNRGVTLKSGSLIAALAHGVPTVATQAELPDERLIHAENIYLVLPRDSQALADGVLRLLSSPQLQQTLRGGAATLANSFSWERIASEHISIYEKILASHPSS